MVFHYLPHEGPLEIQRISHVRPRVRDDGSGHVLEDVLSRGIRDPFVTRNVNLGGFDEYDPEFGMPFIIHVFFTSYPMVS